MNEIMTINKIEEFFNSNIKGKTLDAEVKKDFLDVLQEASQRDIISSSKLVALVPESAHLLIGSYKQGGMDLDVVEEQLDSLNHILQQLTSSEYNDTGHISHIVECVNYLNLADKALGSREYIYFKAKEQFTNTLEDIDRIIVLEGSHLELSEEAVMETVMARTQAEFDIAFTEAFLTSDDEFTMESIHELIRLSNRYDGVLNDMIVLEADKRKPHEVTVKSNKSSSGQSVVRKASVKLDEKSRKAAHKLRKSGADASAVIDNAKRAGGRFTSLVDSTLGKLNDMQKEERLEAVLQGGMRRRASTIIRTAITTGAVWAVSPALGIITLLTSAALRSRSDLRLKREILGEYENELKLVREKMRDAEAAGDRKKKYELMRLENHLEKNIERISSPIRMNKPKLRKG